MSDKETKSYKLIICMECNKIIPVSANSRIKYCSECRGKRIAEGKAARKKGEN